MTYPEKLRSPLWQKKRLQILERDNWKCVFCGNSTEELQVHHIVYKKNEPWEYPDYLYQTLCLSCHRERTKLIDKAIDSMRIAIAKIPNERLQPHLQKLFSAAMLEIEVEQ